MIKRLFQMSCFALSLTGVFVGCRREPPPPNIDRGEKAENAPLRESLLTFPDELRVDDNGVNEFVIQSMNTCAAGNYDDFRLLWSTREDPLPRHEYEQGWQAVQRIRIRALEKVRVASKVEGLPDESNVLYAIYADVTLDPQHKAGQRVPHRRVVSLLVRENNAWKLAQAPKELRDWLTNKIEAAGVAVTQPVNPPAPPERQGSGE